MKDVKKGIIGKITFADIGEPPVGRADELEAEEASERGADWMALSDPGHLVC